MGACKIKEGVLRCAGIKCLDFSGLFSCLSQCDAVSVLEKEHDYREEHFDFIQSHIRRFCLQCILSCAEEIACHLEARRDVLMLNCS